MQVPPQFSAVKIDGERAYKRARAGEDIDLEARALWVEELVLVDRPDMDHVTLEMVCGKGGYVRSIARDLGQALGCFAHVRALRRLWSGPFEADEAISFAQIEELAQTPELDTWLRPMVEGLADLPEVTATDQGATRLRNGNPGLVIAQDIAYGEEVWASYQGQPLAIGRYKAGELHPSRVFNL